MTGNNFTILIKKSDGTQVRMTLDEFKVYKANLKNNNQTVVQKDEVEKILPSGEENTQPIIESVVQSSEDSGDEEVLWSESDKIKEEPVLEKEDRTTPEELDLPMISSEHSLANTAPVKDIFIDEAMYKKAKNQEIKKTVAPQIEDTKKQDDNILSKWSSEDHKSLLEEDDEEVKKHQAYSSLPSSNNDLVNKILSQLDFFVAPDLSERLQSLILSRIKDIRTDEQVLDYALKNKESGGLGFSQPEAEELVLVIKKNFNGKVIQSTPEKITNINPEKKIDFADKIKKTNFNNKKIVFDGKPTLHDVIKPVVNQNLDVVSNNSSIIKKSVGPLDELRTFDLKDWRRLSNNPVKAGEDLLNKFLVLKKNSILSYFDAITAWRQSPLYNMYNEIIVVCVSNQEKIRDYLFEQDKSNILSPEEFDELVKVNKNLV